MFRLPTFFLGMIAGAALLHIATNYHIVRANDGIHFVAKQPPRLAETYVDIRSYGVNDWASHAQLASALVQANQQQLLTNSATGAITDAVHQAIPAWPKDR